MYWLDPRLQMRSPEPRYFPVLSSALLHVGVTQTAPADKHGCVQFKVYIFESPVEKSAFLSLKSQQNPH